jgi:hypothetical protein
MTFQTTGRKNHKLFFISGIGDESHGLFGYIKARGDEEDGDEQHLRLKRSKKYCAALPVAATLRSTLENRPKAGVRFDR